MRDLSGSSPANLRRTLIALLMFVILDAIAILLTLAYAEGAVESRFFRIGRERGFGEILQYIKQIWMIVMLVRFSRICSSTISIRWIALFCAILLDDAIGIHEEVGVLIHRFASGVSTAAGEAMSLMLVEGLLFVLVLQRVRSLDGPWRTLTVRLLLALTPLLLFGGLVDALITAPFVEETGEAIAFTLLFGAVHGSRSLFARDSV